MIVGAQLIEIHQSIFAVVRAAKLCTVPIVFASSSVAPQEHLSMISNVAGSFEVAPSRSQRQRKASHCRLTGWENI